MADRPDPVTSLVLETNKGGVPVTLCACGVLLVVIPQAWQHIDNCPAMAAAAKQEDDRG